MMKIVIKTTNVKLTREFEEFIEEKINSLEKFSKIFYTETKGKLKIEAWVEIGKTTLHHQKGPFFYAKCQMKFPKQSLMAIAQRKDLKLAITEVRDKLQRELKQYKEKLFAQTKRRARVLKKDLKISPAARFYRKGRIREEGI